MDKTEFLALRREALVIACDREFFVGVEPIPVLPACPGFYVPIPDGLNERLALMEQAREAQRLGHLHHHYERGTFKSAEERLAVMVRKAEAIRTEIKEAKLFAVFDVKRQQYLAKCSSTRKFARENHLPVPYLPLPPANPFANARQRNRWLTLDSVI